MIKSLVVTMRERGIKDINKNIEGKDDGLYTFTSLNTCSIVHGTIVHDIVLGVCHLVPLLIVLQI